ncbi:hypothetical protein [Piscirickettsia salmonis]|nr:hypothetical protein [Piscirickettsia salmonis]
MLSTPWLAANVLVFFLTLLLSKPSLLTNAVRTSNCSKQTPLTI